MRFPWRPGLLPFALLVAGACAPASRETGSPPSPGAGGAHGGAASGGESATGAGAGDAGAAGAGQVEGGAPPVAGAAGFAGAGTSPPPAYDAPGVDLIRNPSACVPGSLVIGRAPLRRVSRVEYNNMVRDLLGEQSRPADGFVSEEKVVGFNSNSYAPVNAVIMRQYWDAAERLAVSHRDTFLAAANCGSAPTDECLQPVIENFAKRAFRGQLDGEESSRLLAIYRDTSSAFDPPTGVQAVLSEVLSSPRFLFVFEFGRAGAATARLPLTSWEVAARLAFYLWRSVPDDALAADAEADQLQTADQVEAAATRLLADPKAIDGLSDFVEQWLDIENMDTVTKDTVFSGIWSPLVAKSLHTETLVTYANFVLAGASFMDLMTSPVAFVNADLASFYGISAPASDGTFAQTQAVPLRRGILTHASFLSAHAHTVLPSPILRGKVVRANVICRPVPPPGSVPSLAGQIPPAPNAPVSGQTTRDLYEKVHVTQPVCAGCHEAMDLVGFGFDDFDALGRALPENQQGQFVENGNPVDASGSFLGTSSDLDGRSFSNAEELVHTLAASSQARGCFTLEQFRYALARVETDADACSLQEVYAGFSDAGFGLKALVLALVRSEAFRSRSSLVPGAACQ